jgi:hypothetical protein
MNSESAYWRHFERLLIRVCMLFTILVVASLFLILLVPVLLIANAIWKDLFPYTYRNISSYLAAVYEGAGKNGHSPYEITRNLLEIANFLSGPLLAAIALVAFGVAWWQLREARRTRMASVYTEITKRWVESDLIASRRKFQEAKRKYQTNPGIDAGDKPIAGALHADCPAYIGYYLVNLWDLDRAKLVEYLRILTFFEDLGVLCRLGYLKREIVLDFIGGSIIEYVELAIPYIKWARHKNPSAGKPDEAVYANLIWLYKKAKRFESTQIYRESHRDIPIGPGAA